MKHRSATPPITPPTTAPRLFPLNPPELAFASTVDDVLGLELAVDESESAVLLVVLLEVEEGLRRLPDDTVSGDVVFELLSSVDLLVDNVLVVDALVVDALVGVVVFPVDEAPKV
jgi:hypothetical protein